MPDYQPGLLYQGIDKGLAAFSEAQEEQKTRAREFKALQEFADAAGLAGKDQTTVMDLESLKGFVRGAESKRAQGEQQRKAQMEQAQFDERQKYHADQLGVSRQGMALEGMRTLGGLWNQSQDNSRANAHLGLAQQDFNLRQQTHADTLTRFNMQAKEQEAQRGAVGGFLRDFNQLADGPQFNGTGMQRPMGQFEAYRGALGRNPAALTPQMMDDLGRMSVSEDRLNQGGTAASEPSIFTDPNGRTYIRHGNNPLLRSKTDEEIAAEHAARTAPRAMAPEGSVEAVLNGVKVLVGPDGRIYKMPAANPLALLLDQAGKGAPAPQSAGERVSNWWSGRGTSPTATTNAPAAAPAGGGAAFRYDPTTKQLVPNR